MSADLAKELARLASLNDTTPRGPWKWVDAPGGPQLVQSRTWGHGGWSQVLTFTTKGAHSRSAQPVFHEPDSDPEALAGTILKSSPFYQGGVWRERGGFWLDHKDHHPVARWMAEGRQAFSDALGLAQKLERDLGQAQALAVWAEKNGGGWSAMSPAGVLADGRWCFHEGDEADVFADEMQAIAAGRAIPWLAEAMSALGQTQEGADQ